MRTTTLCLSLGALLCTTATAQRLAAFDQATVIVGGLISEIQPPTPILPAVVPPIAVYPTVPALPVLPGPVVAQPGDSTFDNLNGYHWFTNGAVLAAMPTPTFPPVGPMPPAFPIPPAVLAVIGGGPVTGIAISPLAPIAGPIMYMTGAPGIVIGCAAVPGMPVVVPPFPIPFLLAAPITGLEWDGATGSLWACDVTGTCYHFMPGGAPLGPPVVPAIALPMPAGDVAIDKTMRPNPVGVRSLYVTTGPGIIDITDPTAIFFPSGLPFPQGLAFIDHPAANPPVGACNCPGTTYPKPFTTGPMSIGNAAWGIGVGGLPPGFPVLFLFDPAGFNPAFPFINTVGCGLGLLGPGLITFGAVADPAGNAILLLNLNPPVLPLGAGPFYNQNLTLCPTDPTLGLVLTPTQVVNVDAL